MIPARLPFVLALPLLAAAAHLAVARTSEDSRAGAWTIESVADDQTGAFERCSARSELRNGVGLAFGLDAQGRWSLRFIGSLGGNPGDSHPVRYRINRGPVRTGLGTVNPDNSVRVAIDDPDALLSELRRGGVLVADAGVEPLSFPLRDTRALISGLVDCGERGSRRAQADGSSGAKAGAVLSDAERRLEALTLAVNILSRSKTTGFEIQPTKAGEGDVTWSVGDVAGSLRIILPAGQADPVGIRADLLAADVRACPGAFSAEAGPGPDSKTTSLSTSCRGDKGRSSEYLAVPRHDGGAYVITLTAAPEKIGPLKALSTSFRDAAVQVVTRRP
jgi:hypothetical protein